MATRIDRNEEKEFAGAIVILAPDGTRIDHLMTSDNPNPVAFWGFVKSLIEDTINANQNVGIGQPRNWGGVR